MSSSSRAINATEGGYVVRLLQQIIERAISARSSDIHIEPRPTGIRVRLRVDGVLVRDQDLPPEAAQPLTTRIKVLAQMDIAERRRPQDGTFQVTVGDNQTPVSVRASVLPSTSGETIVLRLQLAARVQRLEQLGIRDAHVAALKRLVQRPSGLLLVTGPTGSGKTSTLYALLEHIDAERRNVVTLEDPVEIVLPAITQSQVHPKAGFTFSDGLRAILRQDPDVILVGEMRDEETAAIALQASLTGHLVLSTLHTNSTVETMTRLVDMGLEAYIVANALAGVLAQRLLRRICPRCAVPSEPTEAEREALGFALEPGGTFLRGQGCPYCLRTGYRGRQGVFELVELDDSLREVIRHKATRGAVKRALADLSIPSIRRESVALAQQGITTLEEVIRTT